jgi:hypothetical protein
MTIASSAADPFTAPPAPATPAPPAPPPAPATATEAPVAPVAAPSVNPFLPPQDVPNQAAASTVVPPRPVGEPIAAGTIVAMILENDPYGRPPRAGCVLQSMTDDATGTHQVIVGWFESNSHPIDTSTLTVL